MDKAGKEFERLVRERNPRADLRFENGEYTVRILQYQWMGYQMRQPEVDALRSDLEFIKMGFEAAHNTCEDLKAENERLREALKECIQPLELYKAYGWPDRGGVVSISKNAMKEPKPQREYLSDIDGDEF